MRRGLHMELEACQGFEDFFAGDLVGWRIAYTLPSDVAVGVNDENRSGGKVVAVKIVDVVCDWDVVVFA